MSLSEIPLVVVTGCCGFIGYSLSEYLIKHKISVLGIDNLNDYYSVTLKRLRLQRLIDHAQSSGSHFSFGEIDIADKPKLSSFLDSHVSAMNHDGDIFIVNLAAQAGVRYSIENPSAYIHSNLVGFSNIIELAKDFSVKHFLYASSSSVYGASETLPNTERDRCDSPLSLYAATKRSNELISYSYSNIYNLRTTGLRFFTAYGPWGRPDMALFLFSEAMTKNLPIQVFNNGKMIRDFTYIDDLVESLFRLIFSDRDDLVDGEHPSDKSFSQIYNIGNSQPRPLMEYISILENCLGCKAIIDYLPMQLGDSPATQADTSKLKSKIGYVPTTPIEVGIERFVQWYLYYQSL